eukprot:2674441-Rhodomonas_salina.2
MSETHRGHATARQLWNCIITGQEKHASTSSLFGAGEIAHRSPQKAQSQVPYLSTYALRSSYPELISWMSEGSAYLATTNVCIPCPSASGPEMPSASGPETFVLGTHHKILWLLLIF